MACERTCLVLMAWTVWHKIHGESSQELYYDSLFACRGGADIVALAPEDARQRGGPLC